VGWSWRGSKREECEFLVWRGVDQTLSGQCAANGGKKVTMYLKSVMSVSYHRRMVRAFLFYCRGWTSSHLCWFGCSGGAYYHHGTLLTCRYSMSGIACTGIRSTRRVATAVEEDLLKGYMKRYSAFSRFGSKISSVRLERAVRACWQGVNLGLCCVLQ